MTFVETSRVWTVKHDTTQQLFVYVGASRDTGRDLSDEYWRCRDKQNLYISSYNDVYDYSKTLVKRLRECYGK